MPRKGHARALSTQFEWGRRSRPPDETYLAQKFDRPVMCTAIRKVKAFYMEPTRFNPRPSSVWMFCARGYGNHRRLAAYVALTSY